MFKYERYIVYSLLICFSFIIIFLVILPKQTSSVAVLNDTKKAIDKTVQESANQQHAAASYFEAMDAWSSNDRKIALAKARNVQATCGLPFDSSIKLLEAQKRAFGEISPKSTEQFAAFWIMHGHEQTPNLIRWMGVSSIKAPEEQGKIMRMISAVSSQPSLPTCGEIITILASYGSRFRNLGWSPEKTILNLSKILVPGEDMEKTTETVLNALEGFTEEKAHELGMP